MNGLVYCVTLVSVVIGSLNAGRSIHRPKDPLSPKITTCWPGSKESYHLVDWHIREVPLFHIFDKKHFNAHKIPLTQIAYRNYPEKKVSGKKLGELAQHVLKEIRDGKRRFTHFKPLKMRDFCEHDKTGLVILKYKNYPFVLKLFVETPQSFLKPYTKGFQPNMLFIMGSTMRHMTGFTRIKNLIRIKAQLAQHPVWSKRVDVPRKWFWEPPANRYFELIGTQVGVTGTAYTQLPAVYGLICDAIQASKLSLMMVKDRQECLDIARYLDFNLDPHLPNFLSEEGTGKLVIIDTEHFPSLMGLQERLDARSYTGWYTKLGLKAFKDLYGQSKRARRDIQRKMHSSYYAY